MDFTDPEHLCLTWNRSVGAVGQTGLTDRIGLGVLTELERRG